jgi:uncharacterized protein CbrC (UPF0167 family)
MKEMPVFRYHPDVVATGSAVPSELPCELCNKVTGLRYKGPIFGHQADNLCLACIASGEAARRLARPDGLAEFTDVGWGVPDDVPARVVDEVAHRTPGFYGWQQEHWLYHCADAAAYLGMAGFDQLRHLPDALESLRSEGRTLGQDAAAVEQWIRRLDVDGDMNAYLFRCLQCGSHLAYSDAN